MVKILGQFTSHAYFEVYIQCNTLQHITFTKLCRFWYEIFTDLSEIKSQIDILMEKSQELPTLPGLSHEQAESAACL